MKNKNYSIGLDIGDTSIGYAVIDDDCNVVKVKHKHAWGAYLFDAGETAAKRRVFRSQRTHYARRRERIAALQMLMSDDVLLADDSFFIKLKSSFLHNVEEDKELGRVNHFNLFEGEYTDKDFYKQYPTIYHLRSELVQSQEKFDIRLVYLAIHHIIKYRGNFLREGEKINFSCTNIDSQIADFLDEYDSVMLEQKDSFDIESNSLNKSNVIEKMSRILQDDKLKRKDRVVKIAALYADKTAKSIATEFAKAMVGYSFSTQKLFDLQDPLIAKENGKEETISFGGGDWDEKEEQYLSALQEYSPLIQSLKVLYDSIFFYKLLQGKEYLSAAMVLKYEKHKYDLRVLKRLLKQDKKLYDATFRNIGESNYVAYVGYLDRKTVGILPKKAKREDFYKKIKETIKDLPDCEDKQYILDEIDNENFLLRLNDVSNSIIPYQANLAELEKILDNQSQYYPTLKENREKIITLLTFRRPYYVGKLKGPKNTCWNESEFDYKLYPWDIKELLETTGWGNELGAKFIQRMTNQCTYFPTEDSLPLNSIIYQAYVCINELSGINVDNQKKKVLTADILRDIFVNLVCKQRSVKKSDIANYLNVNYHLGITKDRLTGFADDNKLIGKMTTLLDMKRIFGEDFDLKNLDTYEEIVKYVSIFEDIKPRKEQLKKIKGLDEKYVEPLSKLRYKGWGRFSKKFLHGILTNGEKSIERKTVLQTMYERMQHVNKIIYDETLGILPQIKPQEEIIDKFVYDEHIEPLYCSPSVKKSIWNCCKLVEEIVKIMGCPPKHIFLETTKEDQEKKKKDSRLDTIAKLYKSIADDPQYRNEACESKTSAMQKAEKTNELTDKVYLWLTQLGRCMYSGEVIPFDELKNCEIDHIVPRHYIKDDSLSNRVLVKKIENQNKSGTLALSLEVRTRMQEFWQYLHKHGFISKRKMNNLNKTEYNENDMVGFVNRQLVETSQTIKEVTDLLKKRFTDTEVRGVKAKMNSLMRRAHQEQYPEFYKLRSLNDMHHAKDAYLTAVIGYFVTVAYPSWGQDRDSLRYKYVIEKKERRYGSVDELVNKRYGLIIDKMMMSDDVNKDDFINEDGEVLWDLVKYNTILKTMGFNDCLIVKAKNFEANRNFYDTVPIKAGAGKVPLRYIDGKPLNPDLYGSFGKVQSTCWYVVKCIERKQEKYRCVGVTAQEYALINSLATQEAREQELKRYLQDEFKAKEIIMPIYQNQKIVKTNEYGTHTCYITSARYCINAVQMVIDKKHYKTIALIERVEKERKNMSTATLMAIEEEERKQTANDAMTKFGDKIKELIIDFSQQLHKYYAVYHNNAEKILAFVNDKYDGLSLKEQVEFAANIMCLGQAKSCQLKMTSTLGTTGFGMMQSGFDPEKVIYIDQSMTGIYCRKYTLADVMAKKAK